MFNIILVKTLPHVYDYFLDNRYNTLYSKYFSFEILKFFQNLYISSINQLKYFDLINYFNNNNFKKVNNVENLFEFSIKGDVIDILFPPYESKIRIAFEFDDVGSAKLLNFRGQYQSIDLEYIIFPRYFCEINSEYQNIKFTDFKKPLNTNIFLFTYYLDENLTTYKNISIINTDFVYPNLYFRNIDLFKKDIEYYYSKNYKIILQSQQAQEISEITNLKKYFTIPKNKQDNLYTLFKSQIPAGFLSNQEKLLYLTDREVFGTISFKRKKQFKKDKNSNFEKLVQELQGEIEVKDFIVHEDYGIGIYNGIVQEKVNNEIIEYIEIIFDNEDKVLLPFDQILKITKYIGPEGIQPKLSSLKASIWLNTKNKVKQSIQKIAKELLEHYAKKEISKAFKIDTYSCSEKYEEFVKEFPFIETEDQIKAINEIFSDINSEKCMNRILIGDVGFGKTEVFCRAIFKTVEAGYQVAILAPTTVLVYQHLKVLKERFKSFNFKIDSISRLNSSTQNKSILDKLNRGEIDVIIGTHTLLSSKIKFKNIALLIIDEEQKFGVKQKEKIKELNMHIHVLSVSATPIPRTLSMALSGIQNFSLLTQPPINRKPIKTFLSQFDENKICQAILNEIQRSGQVFFVNDRVSTIYSIEKRLKELLPSVRFEVIHGQMKSSKIENILIDFLEKRIDCLVSTSIIENGLDIPNANTIIINKAQNFGLSQIYQLRGRIGRSEKQAYCYIFYDLDDIKKEEKNTNKNDKKIQKKKLSFLDRLHAIVDNQDLGSGFRIASRDLEIRGSGNILGEQQSGHINLVGYALYVQLLQEEIEKLKSDQKNIF